MLANRTLSQQHALRERASAKENARALSVEMKTKRKEFKYTYFCV